MRKTFILTAIALVLGLSANAQTDTVTLQKRWQHSVQLGVGIGASAPVPIPNRISEMSYTPYLCYAGGYKLRCALGPKVGVKTGLQLRHQGMSAQAKVYQMFTQASIDDADVSGYFTGYNETDINATYISVPLLFSFAPNEKWTFDAGLFAAFKVQGHFGGAVKDGYIRIDTPTGDRAEVDYESFDFSDEINPFNFGIQIGAERNISSRWSAWLDFTWALNSTFKSTFRGLEYSMYNIYGLLGVGYHL